jgi:hypothetical protein
MQLTSDLSLIRNAILDFLRREKDAGRIRFDVIPHDSDCGWSARSSDDLTNDQRRAFIAARFAAIREFTFTPD